MIAAFNGNSEIIQLLLEYNADPNIWDDRNRTALDYAEFYEQE